MVQVLLRHVLLVVGRVVVLIDQDLVSLAQCTWLDLNVQSARLHLALDGSVHFLGIKIF
jgi:hypothetical protein